MADPGRLSRALDFVESRLLDDIGAGDMAGAAFLSPFHFARVFSAAFLAGPWEWIVRRRLAEAAKALAAGGVDATGAAYEFGFSGPDVFARAMKRAYGVLPSDLRRGLHPKRPLLERPSAGVVSFCADPARVPKVSVVEPGERRLRGETVLAGTPPDEDRLARMTAAARTAAERTGGEDIVLVSARGSFGQGIVVACSERGLGNGSTELLLPGGKWLACSFAVQADFQPSWEWFHAVALSVAPVSVDDDLRVAEIRTGPERACRILARIIDR